MRRMDFGTVAVLLVAAIGVTPPPAAAQAISGELLYTSVQPCRVFDTRAQAAGALAAGSRRTFRVVGTTGFAEQGGKDGGCGVPGFAAGKARTQAVMLNFIAVGPTGPGHLTVWPSDQVAPHASIINYAAVPGLNIANGLSVPVRQDVEGADITVLAAVSSTHVVADVVGFFSQARARRFYLTRELHRGIGPLTACAAGFHMASLWEIFDVTVLEYDTARGTVWPAEVSEGPPVGGPPTGLSGWIRTNGTRSFADSAGTANCNGWQTSNQFDHGTAVKLGDDWAGETNLSVRPWKASSLGCVANLHVWCVEDR